MAHRNRWFTYFHRNMENGKPINGETTHGKWPIEIDGLPIKHGDLPINGEHTLW